MNSYLNEYSQFLAYKSAKVFSINVNITIKGLVKKYKVCSGYIIIKSLRKLAFNFFIINQEYEYIITLQQFYISKPLQVKEKIVFLLFVRYHIYHFLWRTSIVSVFSLLFCVPFLHCCTHKGNCHFICTS